MRKDERKKRPTKDFRTYTVYGLLSSGSRFTDDYDEECAVRDFLKWHPEADEATVRAELRADIQRYERQG